MWLASETTQDSYKSAVAEAINDSANFKSDPRYNSVVGMSEQWQAPFFYEFIKKNKKVFDKINLFARNDLIGSPAMWVSKDGLSISPNTLRYVKTLVDIEIAFGNLNDFVIAELGVGYGGLSFILNTNNKLKDYILCDLPEVQKLAQKYLSAFNITTTNDQNKYNKYDLFISEFCLSEFDDEHINSFYKELILKSDRVYLTMNLHDERRKQFFLNKIGNDFNIIVSEEYPKTHWPNYIVIGKKKDL